MRYLLFAQFKVFYSSWRKTTDPMTLGKPGYMPRIIDKQIKESLGIFGVVSIEGPKWCGKTWSSLNHANSVNYIMDPAGVYGNRERALLNPTLALEGNKPHLIDEWQEVPGIWDAVRFDVDQTPGAGKYILTGSATPRRDAYKHSGTGRFAIIRMRPMSLFESGDSSGAVSLESLFQGNRIDPFSADMDLGRLIDVTVRGGWPETLLLPIDLAGRVSAEYIGTVLKNEAFGNSFVRRNPLKLRTLLRALARNNATTVNISTLSLDIDGDAQTTRTTQANNELSISRNTTSAYLEDLSRMFIIEDIAGWSPGIRSKTRIRMSPKKVFADPSLAIAALGLNRERLLHDLNTYGFMFENLCLRDFAVYAESKGGALYHYRDNSGIEVDAVIEMPDGAWGAFEIRLGEHRVEAAAQTLRRMCNKLVATGARPPACLCVITGGGFGRLRDDGIYVIPINALKP